jgi:nitrogen fixation/metabolism regulation signal transduction histidine kinase
MPYRRSIFLINKNFQLKFAFFVCSWLFALSLVYPLIIHNLFEYFARYAELDPTGPPLAALKATRKDILVLLVLLECVFLGVTFLISIFISHRIAGPLYKLQNAFETARTGNLDQTLFFRKKDHFHEIAQSFNEMLEGLRGNSNVKNQSSKISDAIHTLENLPALKDEDRQNVQKAISVLQQIRK